MLGLKITNEKALAKLSPTELGKVEQQLRKQLKG
jgi:hypothetical protein